MGYERNNEHYQDILSRLDSEFSNDGGVNGDGVRPDVMALLAVAEAHKKGEDMVMAKLAFVPDAADQSNIEEYVKRVHAVLADRP